VRVSRSHSRLATPSYGSRIYVLLPAKKSKSGITIRQTPIRSMQVKVPIMRQGMSNGNRYFQVKVPIMRQGMSNVNIGLTLDQLYSYYHQYNQDFSVQYVARCRGGCRALYQRIRSTANRNSNVPPPLVACGRRSYRPTFAVHCNRLGPVGLSSASLDSWRCPSACVSRP
jgi:hypothetical protein